MIIPETGDQGKHFFKMDPSFYCMKSSTFIYDEFNFII